ncbi:hypothetical protein EHS15_14950 [Leptospira idonii]|uniref:Uncharacterized protein n=1 Tax=Leptospira idonii TaxID=1193500 RepID=A0A4R9M1Q1_9LEPT|nr:hypothetical protein EHS15_14950 [Leptospira idonii]
MKTSLIWNLSQDRPFPLELWKHPKIKIQVNQISLKDLEKVQPSPNDINILFLQLTLQEWKSLPPSFRKDFDLHPFVSLIIVSSPDGVDSIQEDVKSNSKYLVLENPLHQRELRLILDRTIQAEFYRSAALDIGNSCLENVGFFEGVFSLAHREYEDSKKENDALKSILQYEEHVKKSQEGINHAMEKVTELKHQELIELHQRVRASEQLDALRERELKHALELQKATEEVLNYSRIEEMNLDKILRAQDRLFEYTEQEIRDLIEENKSLKKKLGLS